MDISPTGPFRQLSDNICLEILSWSLNVINQHSVYLIICFIWYIDDLRMFYEYTIIWRDNAQEINAISSHKSNLENNLNNYLNISVVLMTKLFSIFPFMFKCYVFHHVTCRLLHKFVQSITLCSHTEFISVAGDSCLRLLHEPFVIPAGATGWWCTQWFPKVAPSSWQRDEIWWAVGKNVMSWRRSWQAARIPLMVASVEPLIECNPIWDIFCLDWKADVGIITCDKMIIIWLHKMLTVIGVSYQRHSTIKDIMM